MTAKIKLTDTQTAILKSAAGRADGNIEPLPSNLRGGARAKVIEGLFARRLIIDVNGHHRLTDAGYTAVGKQRPTSNDVAKRDPTHALQKLEVTSRTIRLGTKLAALVVALRRPLGATSLQLMLATGWQPHTVRGAISGMLRKKLGLNVVLAHNDSGERVYRVV